MNKENFKKVQYLVNVGKSSQLEAAFKTLQENFNSKSHARFSNYSALFVEEFYKAAKNWLKYHGVKEDSFDLLSSMKANMSWDNCEYNKKFTVVVDIFQTALFMLQEKRGKELRFKYQVKR